MALPFLKYDASNSFEGILFSESACVFIWATLSRLYLGGIALWPEKEKVTKVESA